MPQIAFRLMLSSLLLVLFTIVMIASGATAEDWTDEIERSGPYLDLSAFAGKLVSDSRVAEDSIPPGSGVTTESPGSFGGGFRLGYRTGQWLSTEVEFETLRHDIDAMGIGSTVDEEISTYAFSVGGKLHVARHENLEMYISTGVGFLNDENYTDFAARFGVGFDLYINPHLAFSVGGTYLRPTGELRNHDYGGVQIGLVFRP